MLNFYVDGSKTPVKGMGIGVHCPELNLNYQQRIYDTNETSQRAEILALAKALQFCLQLDQADVVIHTDSQYVYRTLTEWYPNWVAKQQQKANMDLWLNVWAWYQQVKLKLNLELRKVKAHVGLAGNEKADQLAKTA